MSSRCKSCGALVGDRYCSACGEKVLTAEDHTLKHYFSALLNAFTFADSKFWNTMKAVMLRPGELSAAYMDGRRVKYMRPVAFFFLVNFVYFAIPVFQTFNTSLDGHLHHMPYSSWAQERVDAELAKQGTTLDALNARYDPASGSNAKLLVVVMVFLLLLPTTLLYWRKQQHLSAYVTASFEFMAFYLWVSTILLGLLAYGIFLLTSALGWEVEHLLSDVYLAPFLIALHFWVAMGVGKRFFRCSWPGSFWRACAMLLGLQFAVTLWQLG